MTEVCYNNVYEWEAKCFVITCALTTVIQLKLIIIKEPSPIISALEACRINGSISCKCKWREDKQEDHSNKKEISKRVMSVQNIGT